MGGLGEGMCIDRLGVVWWLGRCEDCAVNACMCHTHEGALQRRTDVSAYRDTDALRMHHRLTAELGQLQNAVEEGRVRSEGEIERYVRVCVGGAGYVGVLVWGVYVWVGRGVWVGVWVCGFVFMCVYVIMRVCVCVYVCGGGWCRSVALNTAAHAHILPRTTGSAERWSTCGARRRRRAGRSRPRWRGEGA